MMESLEEEVSLARTYWQTASTPGRPSGARRGAGVIDDLLAWPARSVSIRLTNGGYEAERALTETGLGLVEGYCIQSPT